MSTTSEAYRGKNPLIRKLASFVPLTKPEREAIKHLCRNPRQHRKGTDLIQEGDKPNSVFLIQDGWAFRYKDLENGSRQIMAYLVPGDLCDIQTFLLEEMDHSIGLLSDAQVVEIPSAEILDLMDCFPRIERALMWATLVDEATLRRWLLNVGRLLAMQRISHLFCELWVRLSVVGLVDEDRSFTMPLTQSQLADTIGLTPVHVNRTLRRLRENKIISIRRGRLTILNFFQLAAVGGFDKVYLHTGRPPVEQELRERIGQSRSFQGE